MSDPEEVFKKLQPEEYFKFHAEKGSRADGRETLTTLRPVTLSGKLHYLKYYKILIIFL